MDTDMDCAVGPPPCTPTRFDPTQPSTSNLPVTPTTPRAQQAQVFPGTPEYGYNGHHTTPPRTPIQANRVNQLREAAAARQVYMQNWMQGYSNSPNRSSRPASVVGSTMSCMSEVSQYSLGGMSQLSINTEMANYPWPYVQNQQPQNVLSTTSGTSSVENDHPHKPVKRTSIGECLKGLESNDLTRQLNSLKELYPLATKGLATAVLAMGPKEYLKKLFYLLFRILRPQQMESEVHEKIVDSTFIILYLSTKSKTCLQYMERLHAELKDGRYPELAHPMGIFYLLLHRAGRIECRYVSKAWLVLSTLLCQSKLKRYITGSSGERRYDLNSRRPTTIIEPDQKLAFEVVQFLLMALCSDIESKSKGLAAAVLRVLVQSSQSAMVIAADRVKINGEMGAIEILLQIMVKDTIHENVLWAAAQALFHFLHHHQYGERFVNLGGAQVLCGLLSHGSSRLLHELLRCLSQIADLPALGKQNMDESVGEVVKLLGANDPIIAELTTGFLMNIGQYNRKNKTILVNCGTTDLVFSVLRLTDEFLHRLANTQESDNIRKRVGNIYENCLCILNNLTKMSSDDILETAKEACKRIFMNKSSAPALLNFIGIGYRFCRRLSISILKRVIDTIPSYAFQFFEIQDTKGEQLPLILMKRVWQSFEKYQKHNSRIMNGEAKPKSESQRRDHEEIACRATKLLGDLFSLKVDNNRFRSAILETISSVANPLQFLERQVSDKMVYEWLSFVWTVTTPDDCLQKRLLLKLAKTSPVGLQRLNQYQMHSLVPSIKELVTKLLQLAQQQQNEECGT